MSMRSPPSSFTTACTREPLRPTQAPTGSMASSREMTATLVRLPTSRAMARISTICCWISGTSSLNSAFTNSGSPRDRMSRGPLGVSSSRLSTARIGVALMEVLAVVLLAVRDDRFRLAELVQHDDELAALDLLDLAGEQVADLGGELVADPRALALADALDDALLGGLHGEAAELGERHLLLEHVADLEVGILVAGLLERRSASSGPRPSRRPAGGATTWMVPCSSSTLSSNLTFGPNLRTSAAWMPSRSRSRRSERSSCFAVVSSRNAANISVEPAMRITPVASARVDVASVDPRLISAARTTTSVASLDRRRARTRDLAAPSLGAGASRARRPAPPRSRPRRRPPSAGDRTRARRPTKRRQCSGQRSGRSSPGETPPARTAARPSRWIPGSARGTG